MIKKEEGKKLRMTVAKAVHHMIFPQGSRSQHLDAADEFERKYGVSLSDFRRALEAGRWRVTGRAGRGNKV